jgi:hypothetical protein
LRAPLYRRICCHIYFQSRGIDRALYLAEDERIRSSRANAIKGPPDQFRRGAWALL